jgi:hypothetical protein
MQGVSQLESHINVYRELLKCRKIHVVLLGVDPLLEVLTLLQHVSVQSNHLQAIYIGFYENYYTNNGSVFSGRGV